MEAKFIVACGGCPTTSGWKFYTPNGILELTDSAAIIRHIVELADGTRSKKEILKDVSAEEGQCAFALLEDYDVLRDIRSMGRHLLSWRSVCGVSPALKDVAKHTSERPELHLPVTTIELIDIDREPKGNLFDLLKKRRSIRLAGEMKFTENDLADLLLHSYSVNGKCMTVPSAGALYSIRMYLILKDDVGSFTRGLYYWVHTSRQLAKIDWPALDSKKDTRGPILGLEESSKGISFILFSHEERVRFKYGNDSVAMIHLEAGHIIQNIYLYCSERGFGACEYSGIDLDLCNSMVDNRSLIPLVGCHVTPQG